LRLTVVEKLRAFPMQRGDCMPLLSRITTGTMMRFTLDLKGLVFRVKVWGAAYLRASGERYQNDCDSQGKNSAEYEHGPRF
jgi:hypothetical protein